MQIRSFYLALFPLACSAFLNGVPLDFNPASSLPSSSSSSSSSLSPSLSSSPVMREQMSSLVLQMADSDEEEAWEGEGGEETKIKLTDINNEEEFVGTVKGVTNFGAFVDIGAECDGLVHISEMAAEFVQDPNEIVKRGDNVNVRVLGVNTDKRQISLTMKTVEEREADSNRRNNNRRDRN